MRHVRKVLKVRSTVERRDMSEKEKRLVFNIIKEDFLQNEGQFRDMF